VPLHTINGQPWPDGTVVTVYPAGAQPAGYDGPPMGVAVETQTVSGGTVTFEALQEDVPYLAYAPGATKRFLVAGLRIDSLRTRIERLEEGREEYVTVRDFGARKGARDNSAAFQRAADAYALYPHIYMPDGYGDLDGTVVLRGKQHWFSDMGEIRQADYGRRTFEIQPTAAGSLIEGFAGGYRDAKPVGDQSVTLAQFAAEADAMIAQDAATVRSAFVYSMAEQVTVRHMDLENVFTGVRGRSSDRYSTQMWDFVAHDIDLRHHDFGMVVTNAVNQQIDRIHGHDTDFSTLNPPHLMYFATFADAPDDSLTANEDATHVDTVSVGGYVANCTDYGNPHGAGSSYKFENLRGTKIDNLQCTQTARGLEILYGDKVAVRGFKAHEGIDGIESDSQQAMLIFSDSVRCSTEGHDIDLLTTATGVAQDVRGVMFRDCTRCYARGGIVRVKYDAADTGSRPQYAIDTCTEITLDGVGCHVEGREHTPIYVTGSSNCRIVRPRVWKADPSWLAVVRFDVNGATPSNNNTAVLDPYSLNFTPTAAGSFPVDTGTGNVKIIEGGTHVDNPRRSSDVSTLIGGPDGISTQTPSSSFVTGAVALTLKAGTYTKIRFAVGSTLTAVTDVRLGVYSSARAKLAETDNLIAVPPPGGALAVNALQDNIPLLSSVTLTYDQVVYLAIGGVGTTFTFMGLSDAATAISVLAPPGGIQRNTSTAWAGGTMPSSLATAGGSRIPWIELIP
jgi:hypothetical protein